MNFFEHQDNAKRQSRRLFLIFLLAVVVIVALVDLVVVLAVSYLGMKTNPGNMLNMFSADWFSQNAGLLVGSSLITSGFIGASSLYKTVRLSFGGGSVARDMGGTLITADVRDPLRKRLYNIVEEMSIASGLPMPELYVMEEEAGINAFAAGSQASNAAVAVTRGALEQLNRDELQGVIAHEFSHVLNGDMRINIRLMGILFGILIISLIGRTMLRGTRRTHIGRSRDSGGGVAAIMLIGTALAAIGYVGLTVGRIIKAAVSRQREYLADASAVQFTRQTEGIKTALMKIGAFQNGSVLRTHDAEEVSHMLFGKGFRSISSVFATHPPLVDRIASLDPSFKPGDIEKLALKMADNAKK